MHSEFLLNLTDAGIWLAGFLALIVCAWLCVAVSSLHKKCQAARVEIAALAEQLRATQEQSQRELLAMGLRVIEADKLVRRFADRIDSIQNKQPVAESVEVRYGQLEAMMSDIARRDASTSQAEENLLALLRRAGN